MNQDEELPSNRSYGAANRDTFGRAGGDNMDMGSGMSASMDSFRGGSGMGGFSGGMANYGMGGGGGLGLGMAAGDGRSSSSEIVGGRAERPPKRRRVEPVDPESEILRKLYVGNIPTEAKVCI